MAPKDVSERATSVASDVDEKQKLDVHNEEVVVSRLTEQDIFRLSEDSLKFKGRAAWKITMVRVLSCA